jgi:hypothetical protein
MKETKHWIVEVSLREKPDRTEAEATLDIEGDIEGQRFVGWGRARRSPGDPNVAQIGDELATARALSDLSHKLLEQAASAIESFEGHEVHVHA